MKTSATYILRNRNILSRTISSTTTQQRHFSALTSYIADVRVKVASLFASSLSVTERKRLFESLNIDIYEKDSLKPQRSEVKSIKAQQNSSTSIGEAVAAAVAKESLKKETLNQSEKERIWKAAEQATLERIRNDTAMKERMLKLERWKKDVEQEYMNEHKDASIDEHPVLGPALLDLGYKRIHITSTQKLLSIPIWEKQRIYRHDRAKKMASDKMKTFRLGIPGIISLYETKNGDLAILDGQHRIGMLSILQQRDVDFDFEQILVEVFPELKDEETHALDIFTEINKAEPVKLVDMPGVAKEMDRRIINEAASVLRDTFPEMFKPSQRCRSPHVNIDNLRDAIFASGLLKRHAIENEKMLVQWLLSKNDALASLYNTMETKPNDITAKALMKAKKEGFYLGLDSSWLFQ